MFFSINYYHSINYLLLDTKKFKEEKEQKINLVEKLRSNKELLKKYKWKRNSKNTIT